MSRRRKSSDYDYQLSAIGHALRLEIFGGALALIGIFLLYTALRYDPNASGAPPALIAVTGWVAPLAALSLIILGLVLIFGERAGYWSAEALVGGELLLLGLMVGAFVANAPTDRWAVRLDGTNGGLIGWAIGSLLLAGLGRWVAMLLVICAVVAGAILLVRYTPLIYLAAAVGRWLPQLPGLTRPFARWAADRPESDELFAPLPQTPNFVAPTTEPGEVAELAEPPTVGQRGAAAQTPAAPRKSAGGQSASGSKQTRTARQSPLVRTSSSLPPPDLLNADSGQYANADVALLQQIIVNTLEDFNVPVRVVHVETGPTVTQFGVEPLYLERAGHKRKVRVSRIVNLADDLALALAAPAVRMEAPVPGRPYVGIEVPNPDKSLVSLRGILESTELRKGGALALPLGRNTAGKPVVIDLTKAPHVLIAGATGSGKSVAINTMITGLLMQHGPERLRFVMVDPKMVELPGYNGIPHLYGKVITDVEQVMGALTWLLLQMDDRYQMFRDLGVRNIDAYNTAVRRQKDGAPLPYLVLVIDELADLMMTAAEDVERLICRLAQMARATGIHLLLATQRPSTDVITGLIKANFPTRIAFSVTSQIDSRVILDTPGAERLLGRGDMLLMRPEVAKLTRVQGCFVSDEEISRVVSFWKHQEGVQTPMTPPWNSILDQLDNSDDLVEDAIEVVRGMKSCSTSMLQRRLGLGYPRAARLMEELEKRHVVGPDLGGGRGREVLLKDDAGEEEDLFGD